MQNEYVFLVRGSVDGGGTWSLSELPADTIPTSSMTRAESLGSFDNPDDMCRTITSHLSQHSAARTSSGGEEDEGEGAKV